MITFTKVFAMAIATAIVIASHAAYAARILSSSKNTSDVMPLNYNDTARIEHHLRPHARKLYTDGEGTYVTSDSVHHYESGVKCWTDYFVVEQYNGADDWKKASGNLDCSTTDSCQFTHMDGHTTCQSWTTEIEIGAGIETEIINFGISSSYELQNCNEGQDTSTCIWNDKQTHCIWTQQEMTYQKGYQRRRCSPNDGDYTAWMKDWDHKAPTSRVNYGCGFTC